MWPAVIAAIVIGLLLASLAVSWHARSAPSSAPPSAMRASTECTAAVPTDYYGAILVRKYTGEWADGVFEAATGLSTSAYPATALLGFSLGSCTSSSANASLFSLQVTDVGGEWTVTMRANFGCSGDPFVHVAFLKSAIAGAYQSASSLTTKPFSTAVFSSSSVAGCSETVPCALTSSQAIATTKLLAHGVSSVRFMNGLWSKLSTQTPFLAILPKVTSDQYQTLYYSMYASATSMSNPPALTALLVSTLASDVGCEYQELSSMDVDITHVNAIDWSATVTGDYVYMDTAHSVFGNAPPLLLTFSMGGGSIASTNATGVYVAINASTNNWMIVVRMPGIYSAGSVEGMSLPSVRLLWVPSVMMRVDSMVDNEKPPLTPYWEAVLV